jgi:Mg-chelatase subunit ChlD
VGKIGVSPAAPGQAVLARGINPLTDGQRDKVVLVLDKSGSMDAFFLHNRDDTRLAAAKRAAETIVRASSRGMTDIGLVTFSDTVEDRAKPSGAYTGIVGRLGGIRADGGTMFAPALQAAADLGANRIILLSDGQPHDTNEALRTAETLGILGVRIDCVGIGDANMGILQKLAEMTNGVYKYCDTAEDLVKTFRTLETRSRFLIESQGGAQLK